jgi:cytoplasmic iron level regulating protein YaaA (DUF328/UPF0246 family)
MTFQKPIATLEKLTRDLSLKGFNPIKLRPSKMQENYFDFVRFYNITKSTVMIVQDAVGSLKFIDSRISVKEYGAVARVYSENNITAKPAIKALVERGYHLRNKAK